MKTKELNKINHITESTKIAFLGKTKTAKN